MVGKYKVITLCGSTKFKDTFMEVQKKLTLEGNIVISVGLFGHSGDVDEETLTENKEMLADMYKRKIDMADEIYVIDEDGYIGEDTKSEIEYARQNEKKVRYLVHPLIGKTVRFKIEDTLHKVADVIVFVEDTFGYGDFAVITEDGEYLYECEIEIMD